MAVPLQSPIDIAAPVERAAPQLSVDYRRRVVDRVNAGSTMRVYCHPSNMVELEGQHYELEQFHFHTPAEHRIKGRELPMEIHLVHKVVRGVKPALAVLVDVGARNENLQRLFEDMPTREDERGSPIDFDPAALFPRRRDYFRFDGSLTTPPFSEGVLWCVFAEPITAADSQIRRYMSVYPPNARELQPRNDRPIYDCRD